MDDLESDISLANDEEMDMDFFHSYYGIASSPRHDDEGGDPMSLDSTNFHTAEYVVSELQNLKVGELLDKDADLMHDIRNLDSDMQMLVYENYNKFIAATETIKRMKNNVEDMDTDMSSIDSNMKRISTGSTELDTSLAGKRSKVEKLVRVHRLLERIQFLSGLPEKLTSMVERESFKDAVLLYKTSSRVLQQYSHILSFNNIEKQCVEIMESLQALLLENVADPFLGMEKRADAIAVLRSINRGDHDREIAMNKKLLALQSERSNMIIAILDLEGAKQHELIDVGAVRKLYQIVVMGMVESIDSAGVEGEGGELLLAVFENNTSAIIGRLRQSLVRILKVIFAANNTNNSNSEDKKEECLVFLQQAVMDMGYLYSTAMAKKSTSSSVLLPTWHRDLADSFLGVVESHLTTHVDAIFDSIAATISQSATEVHTVLHSAASICSVVDDLGAKSKGEGGVVSELHGSEIQLSVPGSLKSTINTLATRSAPHVKDITDATLSAIENLLEKAMPAFELHKVKNFGEVQESQQFIVQLLLNFFDRLVKTVTGRAMGAEHAFVSVDIYASVSSEFEVANATGSSSSGDGEQKDDAKTAAAASDVRLVCSTYLRELTTAVSPHVLMCLEKCLYFSAATQANETTRGLMLSLHKVNERLIRTSTLLVIDYAETCANHFARVLTDGKQAMSIGGSLTTFSVSKAALSVAVGLDNTLLAACTFLDKAPPSAYSKTLVMADLAGARRQHASKQQIDIEKLFAAPVMMMPLLSEEKDADPFLKQADQHHHTSTAASSYTQDNDGESAAGSTPPPSLGCIVMKSTFKSALEIVRTRNILGSDLLAQMKGDMGFLRVVCEALIEDVGDVLTICDLYEGVIDERVSAAAM